MFQTDLFDPMPEPIMWGKHYIEPCGYYGRPGSGPSDKTCRVCRYRIIVRVSNRTVSKCEKYQGKWTHSRRTDIKISIPACQYFVEV